jgi:signal transduction histidine kinase/CheY-like chemotaxis protein
MGALMRAYDWAGSALGSPDAWPCALKTSLRLLLSSSQPMILWWGDDLIQFYNDAYLATSAPDHPAALGKPGRACWTEIWGVIGQQVEDVMSGKGATWQQDALVPMTMQGTLRNVWWNYGFNPIEDEDGVRGVLIICSDVTREHESRAELARVNQELALEVASRKQAEQALALERDKISDELAESRGDLARQLSDWKRLHAISSELLKARSTQDLLQVVLDAVISFHGANKGVLSLYDPEKNGLVTRCHVGLSAWALEQLDCIPVGSGACGLAFLEKRRIVISDTSTDPIYEQYRDFAARENIEALYSTPFFGSNGEPLGVLSVYFAGKRRPTERELELTDICAAQIAPFIERENTQVEIHLEQERSQNSLRKVAGDLSDVNQRLNEFLATLAHELRNPLAPIRTGLQLMQMSPDNPASMARIRDMMQRQTDHLIHLVNDLLDMARIRNGKIDLKKEVVDLKEVIASSIETTLPVIEAKHHLLTVSAPDGPVMVEVDRNRISQVIGNILTNAAKYSHESGRIGLVLEHADGWADIRITDDGIGISTESLPHIFDLFTQVGRGAVYSQGGLGIGLSLVQRLTEMHGGSVSVSSPGNGLGSTFSVRLPVRQPDASDGQPGSRPSMAQIPAKHSRILIADDNEDAAEMTKQMLELLGHTVAVAHDGLQALQLAQAAPPDVALLDIGMPGLNGYELATKLRTLPQTSSMRLIAVTGWGTTEDRDRSKAAGFDMHMTKPIDVTALNDMLERDASRH